VLDRVGSVQSSPVKKRANGDEMTMVGVEEEEVGKWRNIKESDWMTLRR